VPQIITKCQAAHTFKCKEVSNDRCIIPHADLPMKISYVVFQSVHISTDLSNTRLGLSLLRTLKT